MDKCTIKNFKRLALPVAILGVLLWDNYDGFRSICSILTLGTALVFITIDKLYEER